MALVDESLDELYRRSCEAVVEFFGVDFAAVLELLSDGRMLARAGHAIPGELAGGIASVVQPGSQPEFVLAAGEPVVVEDLASEGRFTPAPTLLERGVRSGLTAAIPGTSGPLGSLGAWSLEPRSFAREEIDLFALISSGLGLASSRRRVERRLETQRAVGEVLASAETMAEAAPRLLRAIGESLDWSIAILWLSEREDSRLRASEAWLGPRCGERERELAGRELEHTGFAIGERLPGRVWEAGEAQWISEIPADSTHPKVKPLLEAGLHSVLAFPIRRGPEVLGVVEVLNHEISEPDRELLDDCERLGRQIGEFIARERAQQGLRASRDELEIVLRQMPIGVTVVGADGRYRFVNEETARINSATPEELIGVSAIEAISDLTILDEDGNEIERDQLPLFRALRGEESPPQMVRFTGPAVRRQSWAIAHAFPLRDGDGPPDAVVSVIEDVTEVKATEQALVLSERRQHEIADTLQRGLLPPEASEVAGLDFDARLHTEEAGTRIGGDFYDVFHVDGDRYAIVIGDVSGKGIGAAGMTALARYTIRTAAMHDPSPPSVLARLNQALLDGVGDEQYLTAIYALVEAVPGGHRVSLASGGHPQPLLVSSNGEVSPVETTGSLLGSFEQVELSEGEARLEPGDALVLFTDGITEAGFRSESPGAPVTEASIASLLSEHAGRSAGEIADAVERRVLAAEGGELRDDATIVVVCSRGASAPRVGAG